MKCSIFTQSLSSNFSVSQCPTQTNNLVNCYHWLPAGVTVFSNIATIYLGLCSQQHLVKSFSACCFTVLEKSVLASTQAAQHSSPPCVYHESKKASSLFWSFQQGCPLREGVQTRVLLPDLTQPETHFIHKCPSSEQASVLSSREAPPIAHRRHCETKGSSCHRKDKIPHI